MGGVLALTGAACGGSGGDGGSAPDTVAPFVTSTDPVNNASSVPVDSVVAVTFSEAIDPTTLTAASISIRAGFNTRAGIISYAGSTATFTPNSVLESGAMYTVHVSPSVTDAAGNALPVDYFWTFTTAPPPDITPPTVEATVPDDDAVSVRLNSVVTVRFSEPMDPATVTTDTLVVGPEGGQSIPGVVSYDPASVTATFTPNVQFQNNQKYSALVTTEVADTAGNHLAVEHTWLFTAEPFPDLTPPEVMDVSPEDDSRRVPLGAVVSARFNEAMGAGSLTSSFTVTPEGGSPLAGVIAYNAATFTATFVPSVPLVSGTTYTARLTTGVTDEAGNSLEAEHSWTFAIIAPRFAFVANSNSDDVSVFRVEPTTGLLTLAGTTAAGDGPSAVTVDPSGQWVYVANQKDNTVTAFGFDAATAALAQVGVSFGGSAPSAVAIDPTGRFVYVTNMNSGNVSAFKVTATGALTNIAPVLAATTPMGVAVHPSGLFAYVAKQGAGLSRFQVDQNSGVLRDERLAVAGNPPVSVVGVQPVAVAVDPSGRFAYVANRFSRNVTTLEIAQDSGLLTEVGSEVPAGSNPVSVSVDPSGRFVYVANRSSNTVSMFHIDQNTGQLAAIAPGSTPTGANPTFVAVDPSGQFAYVTHLGSRSVSDPSNITIYRIDQATGALTEVGTAAAGLGPTSIAILGSTN